MKKIWFLALFTSFCFYLPPTFAVKVETLYRAKIPANTQSVEERKPLLGSALAEVLVKVTGNTNVINNPKIKSYLANPSQFVQEYTYETVMPANPKPFMLEVWFNPESVNKLLRGTGVPLWGQSRPLILTYLDYQGLNATPEILGDSSPGNVVTLVKQKFSGRGLPVIFPTMDATDLSQINVNDVNTFAFPALINSAKRYGSEGILLGKITQRPNDFVTQWKFRLGAKEWVWNFTGSSLDAILDNLSNSMANTLSVRFAAVETNQVTDHVLVKFIGITQSDDFVSLIDYLKNMTPVADVVPKEIKDTEVLLKISLHSNVNAFVEAISLSPKFSSVPDQVHPELLTYQWNH